MKMKCFAVLTVVLFLDNAKGMGGLEHLETSSVFESVSFTPTNLTLKFNPLVRLNVFHGKERRSTSEYVANNEALILTPEQVTALTDLRHGWTEFTPVSFKNQQKGFRILKVINAVSFGGGVTTNVHAYVALGDTPVELGEDNVEMIMESYRHHPETGDYFAEWKKHEKPQPVPKAENDAQETSPVRENPATVTQGKTPVNVAEDGQDEEKSKTNMFWLGVGLFHCLLAILWLARKKRKRETKN